MLTKTLKFDDDVLEIVKTMTWSADGKLGTLTCGQLDRNTYERTNKALAAMGGKWNRKLGGHAFHTDPRPNVEGLLQNGTLLVERDGFFETPLDVIDRMTALVWPDGRVLEPSAGLGAIAKELRVPKSDIQCIEKNTQRAEALQAKGYAVQCADFLTVSPSEFDTILMNPPFEEGQDIDHVMHAFKFLAPGGSLVSVMSAGAFFRSDRKATYFRDWLASVHGTMHKLPDNSFKASGTVVNACLVVINA